MNENLSNMSDSELYYCLKGDSKLKDNAFAEIYSRYSQRLFQYCRRLISNKQQAEDVFQETFIQLIQSAQKERMMNNLQGFMLRIARNIYFKNKRDEHGKFVSLEDFDIGFDDNNVEKKEISEILVSAMELLPTDYRESLVLQVYNGLSYQEIADVMDVPVTTIRNWIVRAKQKLRETLIPYFDNRVLN